ncbi:hypothetical protein CANDROIZ_200018 [Candidatus Roizmanbacteria bacterium]|nr:hypothetical protein CANDROIZ_200018 [Candidatus Roizmanbacteria bacterium]
MKYRRYYDPRIYKTGESSSEIQFKVQLESLTDELRKQVIESFIKSFCVGCLYNPQNRSQESGVDGQCSTPNKNGAAVLSFPAQQNTINVFNKSNCFHLR